jgi:hypothetical protein
MAATNVVKGQGMFKAIGGASDTAPVDMNRVKINFNEFGQEILTAIADIRGAMASPRANEQFMRLQSNVDLANQTIAELNYAYKTLKNHFPPAPEPADAPSRIPPGTIVELYGVFLFNRIQEAMTTIQGEIDAMNAALAKNPSHKDKTKLAIALNDLVDAHQRLAKVHAPLNQKFGPAANPA